MKKLVEALKKLFKIGRAEMRISTLKKVDQFSLDVQGEVYTFRYDELSEELYLTKHGDIYRMVNWAEVLSAVARNHSYLTVYILNPDEMIPAILELNHFKLMDKLW